MKITFLTNSIGFAGAVKMMAFVANSMAERGHNVSVINFNSFGNYLKEVTQVFNNSISIISYHTNLKGNKRRLGVINFALEHIKVIKPDVIICFTTFPNYVGKIIGTLLRIPSIMSERGDPNVTINKKNFHSLLELLIILLFILEFNPLLVLSNCFTYPSVFEGSFNNFSILFDITFINSCSSK